MKVIKDENLINEQMKTISNLQEQIKLLKFDKSEDLKKIRELKFIMQTRKKTNDRAIEELSKMYEKNDFSEIKKVLYLMKKSFIKEKVEYDEE